MNDKESKRIDSDRDKLLTDVQAVLADGEELLNATANQGGEKVAAIRAKMTERLSAAKDKLLAAEQQIVRKTRAAARATDEYVNENPWQSVLIASGVGLVIGFMAHWIASSSKS